MIIAVLSIVALALYKNNNIIVTINGEQITRATFTKEMELQYGKAILDDMISKKLVEQEASKKKVTAGKKEIDAEYNRALNVIASSGLSLNEYYEQYGMTEEELKTKVRLQVLADKMVGKEVKISDKEIEEYVEENKESYPEGVKDEDKEDIRSYLSEKKKEKKYEDWMKSLRKKAKITGLYQ